MSEIKIVKRPRRPREKCVSCEKCCVWLRVEPGARVERSSDRDGVYVMFECTACGHKNYVDASVWDGQRGKRFRSKP